MASTDQELFDLYDSALTARLEGGAVEEYRIGSQDLRYISIDKLEQFRDKYATRIARATAGRGAIVKINRPTCDVRSPTSPSDHA